MNGDVRVYVVFDASHSRNPARSDLRYYFLLRAWLKRGLLPSGFRDVHAAASRGAPRDLRRELIRRFTGSDLVLVIVSDRTRASPGWLSWEIEFGAGSCGLPLVCTYPGQPSVDPASGHVPWWPDALHNVLNERGTDGATHVPFAPRALAAALSSTLRSPTAMFEHHRSREVERPLRLSSY